MTTPYGDAGARLAQDFAARLEPGAAADTKAKPAARDKALRIVRGEPFK